MDISKNHIKTWVGSSLQDICKGKGPWSFSISPLVPTKYHQVLYQIPVNLKTPPKPHIPAQTFHWDEDYVRMPYSVNNVFPVVENGISVLKPRWKLIIHAFSNPITSTKEFEVIVGSYNKNLPKFSALHTCINEVLDKEEKQYFFETLLPAIVKLALQLPEILPGNLPLLRKNHCKSVSLSQLQIASLLANAFICTFPWRKDMVQYPGVNFSQLFSADSTFSSEKIKCILHYFKRVTKNNPIGVVTFERKFIPRNNMPRWDYLDNNLGNTRVHIDSEGTIEDNGLGLLQVDFANKNIGGGVLGYGCVQEEIRFIICPELIISRLFVEQMGDQEAVVITGAERYSDYTGYAETFTFAGDHCDGTPHDDYGRRRTTLVAIDATHFGRPRDQFYPSAMLREVNKAFVGFGAREKEKENAAPVASGNWGCGAFRGDARLKALLQLMAVCAAGRDLVYYSFGDEEIKEDFYKMYLFLANNRITIKQLWRFLSKFSSSSLSSEKLYSFIQQSYFDSKNQPSIRKFLGCIAKPPKDMPSTSSSTSSIAPVQEAKQLDELDSCDAVIDMEGVETVDCDIQEDIIPETPPEEYVPKSRKVSLKSTKEEIAKKIPKNHDEIVSLLGLIDGNANKPKNRVVQDVTFLSELDKFRVNCKTRSVEMINCPNVTMDVEEDVTDDVILEKPQKRKITDYFSKHSKS